MNPMAIKKVGDFFARPSTIIVLIVIAVLVYVYLSGRKAGKNKASDSIKKDLKVDVDKKLLVDKDGKEFDPKPITDRLYKDIKGITLLANQRDVEVYQVLTAMPDERIKAVANDWLDRYFDEDKESLRKALSSESGTGVGFGLFGVVPDSSFEKLQKAVIAKLTNLGIE
jgi:hypothetical protein